MEVISLVLGALLLIAGVGFIFVKVDDDAWRKDDRRFGTPPPSTFLSPYFIVRLDGYKVAAGVVIILLGLVFLTHGLGWIQPG